MVETPVLIVQGRYCERDHVFEDQEHVGRRGNPYHQIPLGDVMECR
jgi:hypothetical protein